MFWKNKHRHVRRKYPIQVSLPVLIRQVIYDSMLMPSEGIADALGLPPISDEVAEMEEEASQGRLEKFSSLIPFIDSHADICARIATAAYFLEDDDIDKLDVDDADTLTKLFRLVALSSSVSCVSTLLSLGLIKVTGDEYEH
jgi:hypothetical protein